jgi:hypothetical protein
MDRVLELGDTMRCLQVSDDGSEFDTVYTAQEPASFLPCTCLGWIVLDSQGFQTILNRLPSHPFVATQGFT